jgi:hypothetical protein
MLWMTFALPGVDSSLCSPMISMAISTHRGSARPSPPEPASRAGISPASAASRPSRAAATQRLTVRTLTRRSAAFAAYRCISGTPGAYSRRGSPGPARSSDPDR